MQVKDFTVKPCNRQEITAFIEKWHYSESINGCIADYCFKLELNNEIIGAMFFGRMAMRGQWKKYSENEQDVIELRRLCCIDDTPKNTESYFIAKCLKWLHKNTQIKVVVSYADAEQGHTGIIYRAANFEYRGLSKGAKVIVWGDRKYHDKSIRTKYNGVLKPFAVRIRDALSSGEAHYASTKGKHCFVYRLRK